MKHNMAKYLNEYDDGSDTDSSSEQEHKTGAWGNLKSLVVPRRKGKKNSQLITPLDIVKDDVVRKAQYSGKEYRIKARPRSYLLSIIAIQAVAGPYPQISKIFADALNKVNPDMLVWARYVQQKRKKSKILSIFLPQKEEVFIINRNVADIKDQDFKTFESRIFNHIIHGYPLVLYNPHANIFLHLSCDFCSKR